MKQKVFIVIPKIINHQIGNIHQVRGEYEKALEKYNRSLKISEEVGDKSDIALTLAQVGRLKYEQRRYQEAISALSRATLIFEELGSPYLELAMKDLDSIKEGIGEDEFNEIS